MRGLIQAKDLRQSLHRCSGIRLRRRDPSSKIFGGTSKHNNDSNTNSGTMTRSYTVTSSSSSTTIVTVAAIRQAYRMTYLFGILSGASYSAKRTQDDSSPSTGTSTKSYYRHRSSMQANIIPLQQQKHNELQRTTSSNVADTRQ